MIKIITKSNSTAVRSMDIQVTILFKVHEDSKARFPNHYFFFHSTSHSSKVYALIPPSFILPFPMQLGQGIIPLDLKISPLLVRSTFPPGLWPPPYRTARITSVYSHSRVYTPKEGSKHCRGTGCIRGTSYLYCQT